MDLILRSQFFCSVRHRPRQSSLFNFSSKTDRPTSQFDCRTDGGLLTKSTRIILTVAVVYFFIRCIFVSIVIIILNVITVGLSYDGQFVSSAYWLIDSPLRMVSGHYSGIIIRFFIIFVYI